MSILIDGLSLGAIYALIALGYTMVYGIAKMLNFAHGDIIMVGAYTVLTTLGFISNPFIALIFAVIVCTAFGVVIEKLAYKPLRSASPLAVLITAIGVSFLLQGYEGDMSKLWESNIFGRPLYDIAEEGIAERINNLPENARAKLQDTLQRITNEGRGTLICILL